MFNSENILDAKLMSWLIYHNLPRNTAECETDREQQARDLLRKNWEKLPSVFFSFKYTVSERVGVCVHFSLSDSVSLMSSSRWIAVFVVAPHTLERVCRWHSAPSALTYKLYDNLQEQWVCFSRLMEKTPKTEQKPMMSWPISEGFCSLRALFPSMGCSP